MSRTHKQINQKPSNNRKKINNPPKRKRTAILLNFVNHFHVKLFLMFWDYFNVMMMKRKPSEGERGGEGGEGRRSRKKGEGVRGWGGEKTVCVWFVFHLLLMCFLNDVCRTLVADILFRRKKPKHIINNIINNRQKFVKHCQISVNKR